VSATEYRGAEVSLQRTLEHIRSGEEYRRSITHWRCLPAREAAYADYPAGIAPALIAALQKRGIARPYTHQAAAISESLAGRHVVIVTPTASGKTLCYNVPVLNALLAEPTARALYLFPTKALAQDQLHELQELAVALGRGPGALGELGAPSQIGAPTYDGDTSTASRASIRRTGQVIISNPDMLHTGILPHHTRWAAFFQSLRYVVIDELHYYRGVLGSHLANVLRRLKRICQFYGSAPQFVCCSATIANPQELVAALLEEPATIIDENGAPAGEKVMAFYNPPLLNRELGIRRSVLVDAHPDHPLCPHAPGGRDPDALFAGRCQTLPWLV
jgi:DEAD/DEAH box helicase domain-containing protein